MAFYSRKMIPAELNYEIHDKELLAVVMAFREWRVYLEGAKFTIQVFTDHKNLASFTTSKELNRRQVRWAETLASYDFIITYRKGSENGKADALSRRPDYQEGKQPVNRALLRQEGQGLRFNKPQIAATLRIAGNELVQEVKTLYQTTQMLSRG